MKSRRTEKQELKNETRRIMEEEKLINRAITNWNDMIADEQKAEEYWKKIDAEAESELESIRLEQEKMNKEPNYPDEPKDGDDIFSYEYSKHYFNEGWLFS